MLHYGTLKADTKADLIGLGAWLSSDALDVGRPDSGLGGRFLFAGFILPKPRLVRAAAHQAQRCIAAAIAIAFLRLASLS